MKKVLIIFLTILILTGCTSNFEYNFDEDNIKSIISTDFKLEDYKNDYLNSGQEDKNLTDEELANTLDEELKNSFYNAFTEGNEEYKKIYSKKDKDNYSLQYEYEYNYDNFDKSYILNNCFDIFVTEKINNKYYYKIKGNYKCFEGNNFIKIKTKYKVLMENSDKKENDYYIWKIKKEDNEILFSIDKNIKSDNNTNIVLKIILSIFLLISIIILFIFISKKKKNNLIFTFLKNKN